MLRDKCGGCGSDNLNVFLDLGRMPLADAFIEIFDSSEAWYPLQLAVCPQCWLVQQMEIVLDDELFNDEYTFFSGTSAPKVKYHAELAKKLLAAHPNGAKQLTVEIASNDGDLLRHFKEAGVPTLGIDPAGGPAAVARETHGLETIVEPFTLKLARRIRKERGQAGLIIANHVTAHVSDLDDYFSGLEMLLSPNGVAVIEFQYVADLIAGNQFDHVYHEHRFHLSLTSVENIANRHGLFVEHAELVEPQGGSMQITLGRNGASFAVGELRRAEEWLRDPFTYSGIQGRVNHIKQRLVELIDSEKLAGRRVAGYAASAKGTTLLNYCGLNANKIEYIVDTTPKKIGRVSPGVHIPVVAPGEAPEPDTYLLLAWNYLPNVLKNEADFMARGGKIIVPIPIPMVF